MSNLACNIRLLRVSRGLTQNDLAEKVGTTQSCISMVESSGFEPSKKLLSKIAKALGESYTSLEFGKISVNLD